MAYVTDDLYRYVIHFSLSLLQLENHPLDRKTFIVQQGDEFVVSRVISQGDDVQRTAQNLPASSMAGFISEGN